MGTSLSLNDGPRYAPAGRPLVVRADATAATGGGHVMRTLSLARRWVRAGGRAIFLGSIESAAIRSRLAAAKIEFTPLEANGRQFDLGQTLETLRRLSEASGVLPWLILDGYGFGADYPAAIRRARFPVLVVDDLADQLCYHADFVLNQNVGADSLVYRGETDTRWLLGPRFALLQPEFDAWRDWTREVPDVARRVLLTVGGSDPHNASARLLESLQQVDIGTLDITVAIGPLADATRLKRGSPGGLSVTILRDVRDMASVMAAHDVAITGAGSTCWELAFMGLPAVVVQLADNQRAAGQGLADAGAAEHGGSIEELEPDHLAASVRALCLDPVRRQRMRDAGRRLVDGSGAQRVLTRLTAHGVFTLRPAISEDMRALWELSNEPSVRRMAFSESPIAWDDHVRWFEQRLHAPGTRMWVLLDGAKLAGQIRYDLSGDEAVIAISVSPAYRGGGLAARLIAGTWESACRGLRAARAIGVVFRENDASSGAFIEAGFSKSSEPEMISDRLCWVFRRALPH